MTLAQDIRFGFRMLAKKPWFTVMVTLVLGVGIGANATVFTLVNAVLFRSLPFEDPDRIVYVGNSEPKKNRDDIGTSFPDFNDWRTHVHKIEALAAFQPDTMNVSDGSGAPERYAGARLTANAFSVIGQKPILGRIFRPEEEARGAAPVVLLGYTIWKDRYAGDPGVLGRTIRVNDVAATVIGVMAQGMRFPTHEDLWMPLTVTDATDKRSSRNMAAFGKLAPGATIPEAAAEMDLLGKQLEKEYPKSNEGVTIFVKTYNDQFNGGPIRVVFLSLLGAVGFVMLIACANVANLLLARSLSRTKEMSIRTALGASRWRVIRQLLVESVLLGLLGGAFGLAISVWGVRMFDLAVANVGKPYWIKFTLDPHVFVYLAAVCLGTSLLFGLAPALHASKIDVNETLKEGGRGTSGGRRARIFSGFLVVSELALAIVLLVGAGLMVRSFMKIYGMQSAVDAERLLVMRLSLTEVKYPKNDDRVRFYERLQPKLAAIPGVEAVAVSSHLPNTGSMHWPLELEGSAPVEMDKRPRTSGLIIGPDYFQAVGRPLLRGRMFDESDGTPGKTVAIVNQRFIAKFWPGQDPIGKRIRLGEASHPWLTVIGVAPEIRQGNPMAEQDPLVYVPFRQEPQGWFGIIARARVAPASLIGAFRNQVQSVDAGLPVWEAKSLQDFYYEQRWPWRVFGSLFAIFAGFALVLAAIGIYAVMSYSVSQRTQEVGVRMALGASERRVLFMMLWHGLKQLGIGLAVGLAAAFGITRVLSSLLVGVKATDPATFSIVAGLLAAAGVLACWIPARRALRVDPVVALRYE